MKEPKILINMHEIRENHFNETRSLAPDEFIKKLKLEASPMKQRLEKNNSQRVLHSLH